MRLEHLQLLFSIMLATRQKIMDTDSLLQEHPTNQALSLSMQSLNISLRCQNCYFHL